LVQVSDRGIWSRSLARLKNHFQRKRITEVQIELMIDLDEHGKQIAEIHEIIEGRRARILDPQSLWNYGFLKRRGNTYYGISRNDLESLLSIRSLSPEVQSDGQIRFELTPSILTYLRKRGAREGERSSRVRIHTQALKRKAQISYDYNQGLHIRAGYEVPGHSGIALLKEMRPTADSAYARVGDEFYPYPVEEDANIKRWIEAGETRVGLDEIPDFFKRDLVLFKNNFEAVLTEPASRIRILDERFRPIVQVGMGTPGWLEFQVSYEVGKYRLPHNLFKNRKGKQTYVQIDENTWVKLDNPAINQVETELKLLEASQAGDSYRIEIMRFPSLQEFIEQIGGAEQLSEDYQKFLDGITDFSPDPEFKFSSAMEEDLSSSGIDLRPYQKAGVSWLNWLVDHSLHGILADDMGLGKTIQMASTIRLAYESTQSHLQSLILCPKSVVRHWYREIKRVYPKATVHEYVGTSRNRDLFSHREPSIVITTYDTAAQDIGLLRSVPLLFTVLDEGTMIKNPDTQRSISVKMLNAAHRFVLSGTPVENRPADLWSIFDFLMKGHLGSYHSFKRIFEDPILQGTEAPAKQLSKRIRPFILRRLKTEVAKDLPERIEMVDWCELTEEQKSIYGQIHEAYVSPIRRSLLLGKDVSAPHILAVLTRLKQTCDHPALVNGIKDPLLNRSEKFDLVVEKVKSIIDEGESVVIFSHFLGALDLLQECVRNESIEHVRVDGSTTDRQSLIDKFNKGHALVGLLSLRAMGHGVNLTGANHVIHFDRWWNPAVEDQATNRVHRIGQTKTVYVHKILTTGTLEERIDKLIEKKREISERIVPAGVEGVQWTREELLEILEPLE